MVRFFQDFDSITIQRIKMMNNYFNRNTFYFLKLLSNLYKHIVDIFENFGCLLPLFLELGMV